MWKNSFSVVKTYTLALGGVKSPIAAFEFFICIILRYDCTMRSNTMEQRGILFWSATFRPMPVTVHCMRFSWNAFLWGFMLCTPLFALFNKVSVFEFSSSRSWDSLFSLAHANCRNDMKAWSLWQEAHRPAYTRSSHITKERHDQAQFAKTPICWLMFINRQKALVAE